MLIFLMSFFVLASDCGYQIATPNRRTLYSPIREKFTADFPEAQRSFKVFEYNLEAKAGERNRDRILKLVFALIDTESGRTVWQHLEYPNHGVTAAILDPQDPDAVILAKQVDRFAPTEEAERGWAPHKAYPGLSFSSIQEVVRLSAKGLREIYDSPSRVTGLRFVDGHLQVRNAAGVTKVD